MITKSYLKLFVSTFVVMTIIIAILLFNNNSKLKYGLSAGNECYLYSYFSTKSKLLVRDQEDLQTLFLSDKYKELEELTTKSKNYLQPDMIFLPVVQQILNGLNYVFIFEKSESKSELLIEKRIAFECYTNNSTLRFPDECKGYYMELGSNIPPDLDTINGGEIRLKHIDLLTGVITGSLNITVGDNNKISGEFVVYDKGKRLFLSVPASHAL